MSVFKQLADDAFKTGNLRGAIEYYTRALVSPPPNEVLTTEQKRTIISNRAQTYLKYGDIYTGLQDCELALSPEYTQEDSPKPLTAKCQYRRAVFLLKFFRFEEAREAYETFERLQNELDVPISGTNKEILDEINKGLQLPRSSKEAKKIKLIKAIQNRGIMLAARDRSNFPYHPRLKNDRHPVTSFNHDIDGPVTENSPLDILFVITAPYLDDLTSPGQKTRDRIIIPEYFPIGDFLSNLFTAPALEDSRMMNNRAWLRQAVKHQSASDTTLLLMTHRGRLLAIPRSTVVKDIWSGARWPRKGALPFKDVRKTPRQKLHEVDGAGFNEGYSVDIYVIPNDKLQEFVTKLDEDFRLAGMIS